MSDTNEFDLVADKVRNISTKKPAEAYLNLECNSLNESGVYERVQGVVALGKGKFENDGYEALIEAATTHYQTQIDAGVAHEDVKKLYITLRAAVFVPAVMQQSKAKGKLSAEAILALQA